MAINEDSLVLTGQLNTVANRFKSELDKVAATGSTTAFQSVKVENGTVKFYSTTDKTGSVVGSFDLPEEIFLDQTGTTLVENFAYSALTYPNSTNPNLDGKTVLVLAVKGDAATPTVKYSFVDLSKLIDAYSANDNSINVNGYKINVKLSAAANNALTLQSDGLHVDISGKVDKVEGKQLSTEDFTTAEKTKLAGLSNVDISGKVDKVTSATAGNFATFGTNGALADSGFTLASDSDIEEMLTNVFGSSETFVSTTFSLASDSSIVNMLNSVFGAGSVDSISRE